MLRLLCGKSSTVVGQREQRPRPCDEDSTRLADDVMTSGCHSGGKKGAKVFKRRRLFRPLLASKYGFLFSVARELEGFRQMKGGFVKLQVMHPGPQVEHVAVGAAGGVEALEDILGQIG
jgi:hypothetical protein